MSLLFLPCTASEADALVGRAEVPADLVARLVPDLQTGAASRVLVVPAPAAAEAPLRVDRIANLLPYRRPKPVTAAGGILVRRGPDGPEVVLIFRRGTWDLPKGKKDRGESVSACARREVNEELGIDDAEIIAPAGTTLHGYAEGNRYAVKTTHWFLMRTRSESFTPQAAEQIERVEWAGLEEAIARVGFDGLQRLLGGQAGAIIEAA